jgi:hypothetical protein
VNYVIYLNNCVTAYDGLTHTFIPLNIVTNLKQKKMKKVILFVFIMIFTLSATTAFASKTDKKSTDKLAVPVKTENKLSEEELSRMTKRVEEIRDMDKKDMTVKEKRELRKELRTIKENVRRDGGYIYIGGGTLLLIIILIILL